MGFLEHGGSVVRSHSYEYCPHLELKYSQLLADSFHFGHPGQLDITLLFRLGLAIFFAREAC